MLICEKDPYPPSYCLQESFYYRMMTRTANNRSSNPICFFQKISQGGSIRFKNRPNVNYRWILASWNMRWSNSRHHSWLQLLFTLLSTIFVDSNIGPKLVNGIQNNPKINFCSVSGSVSGPGLCTQEQITIVSEIVLGVDKNFTFDDVKKAYRKLSLKVHPDKNKAPGSDEAFKKVSKAFKCLSDEESRKRYDLYGFSNG
ncbi:putative DnaJ domain, Chaperone J-domain superfamily [Helianthus annuus]|uniref:DnaJ domain, Chaperone J-domain superfamily n=1 Tax=Helianthus annuus TaxID=4232 RepID=A0A9K3I8L2_HELAN|nr:uncharacterized protein LOC110879517 isoform X1 [Helianthus annuus]KAF5792468.1 putative DnaJ domain, Chaperone J-domain superfamily [Helianthus annuus]KAJ0527409.1 putative DnaJ domain, Chaperone J-domain superfamily [Helianthus annuus]KAJ0536115.1 putative DnaJ domain, Chaperone J-domain superfamily [Helianthus annuus]KAJ0543811.1 putative DnaJ domain, Chaperone J-domain superfamily [Helianthus annuus]KAJ0708864.1 putative DnaJ domain, Chaperone J-domain superfamily [Helianthus annuus]